MRPVRGGYGWFWLVQIAAVVDTALLFAAGVILRDAEALALAFVVLLTLGWILFRPGRIVPGLVLILAITGYAAATGATNNGIRSGDLVIAATNARYSTTTLTADHGTVTVDFTNNDLFWHTFTVTNLGVDIRSPVKGHERLSF